MLWSIGRKGSLRTYIEFEFKGILAGELYISGWHFGERENYRLSVKCKRKHIFSFFRVLKFDLYLICICI